jgi:hypothetical protein
MTEGYITRLKSSGEVVCEVTKPTQSEAMVAVAEFLVRERGLLNNVSLPYSPGRRRSPLLGRIQDDLHGQEHEIGSECYVDTLANRETKKRNIERLAAECSLSVEFGGAW